MLGAVCSCALFGIDAFPVDVEVDVRAGQLPSYHVVGLPNTSVREGATRIRSALEHVGLGLPKKKVTVNLAPAGRRKEGAAFDLPIAVAVLMGDDYVAINPLADLLILGELGLDGSLRPVRGALSAALLARRMGLRGVLLPRASAAEAAVVQGVEVYGASHLSEVVAAMRREEPLMRVLGDLGGGATNPSTVDLADVRGQAEARAALEVAVAGGHNLLLSGPPGIGKTMLARRIPTVLPPMTYEESLETTQVYSAVGKSNGLCTSRPFRAPHHSVSAAGLLGGGSSPRPGEISLAHNGVLFLDELPEFTRSVLESLRQPLEDRVVTIGRVAGTITLPASFLLVASANPCPCGWYGSGQRTCTCSPGAVARYRNKLSGPLLDRIDLQVHVRDVPLEKLRSAEPGESSAAVRARVVVARERQQRRLAGFGHRCNAEMGARALRETCPLTPAGERTLARLHESRRGMTARSIDRLIKVARTVADLVGYEQIDDGCIYEAMAYRAVADEPIVDSRGFEGLARAKPNQEQNQGPKKSTGHYTIAAAGKGTPCRR